ncbi:MAG: hypothetical protein ACFE0J_20490 [Elainellaceae cyanobacterium]
MTITHLLVIYKVISLTCLSGSVSLLTAFGSYPNQLSAMWQRCGGGKGDR